MSQPFQTSEPLSLEYFINCYYNECSRPEQYNIIDIIGSGSYGVVVRAYDNATKTYVAIKRIDRIFCGDLGDTLRVLRELRLLRLLNHPNIVKIKKILLPRNLSRFKTIYVVFDLMECSLKRMIELNDGELTQDHFRYMFYQMLNAMAYLHDLNVYHRDLKPENVLVNSNSATKICDFGLARIAREGDDVVYVWTDYIATRWYRAPELLGAKHWRYSKSIDIWSLGCIFAEMLTGYPLFPGRNTYDQVMQITRVLGVPEHDTLMQFYCEKGKSLFKSRRLHVNKGLLNILGTKIDADGLDLICQMLELNPSKRITAEDALKHQYFTKVYESEPYSKPFPLLYFEPSRNIHDIHAHYLDEINMYQGRKNRIFRSRSLDNIYITESTAA